MKRKAKTVLWFSVASLIAVGFGAVHYQPKATPTLVHPVVRAIAEPVQEAGSACYGDGGSASLWIIDANGCTNVFWIAHPIGQPTKRNRMYIGHYRTGIEIDEQEFPHTRRALFRLAEDRTVPLTYDASAFVKLSANRLYIIRALIKQRQARKAKKAEYEQ